MPKIIVLVPCFCRIEYTQRCIESLEKAQDYKDTIFYLVDDGSNDGTSELLEQANLQKIVVINNENVGLRNVCADFFGVARDYDYMVKMDNDCAVPENWLNQIMAVLERGQVDIVSPNVNPSNAAFTYGREDEQELGFRPSKTVGGLWAMSTKMLDSINFETYKTDGIRGAFALLNQIIVEKEPRVGWLPQVTVEDIGHWSGEHPDHIASEEHRIYSAHVGRNIQW